MTPKERNALDKLAARFIIGYKPLTSRQKILLDTRERREGQIKVLEGQIRKLEEEVDNITKELVEDA